MVCECAVHSPFVWKAQLYQPIELTVFRARNKHFFVCVELMLASAPLRLSPALRPPVVPFLTMFSGCVLLFPSLISLTWLLLKGSLALLCAVSGRTLAIRPASRPPALCHRSAAATLPPYPDVGLYIASLRSLRRRCCAGGGLAVAHRSVRRQAAAVSVFTRQKHLYCHLNAPPAR